MRALKALVIGMGLLIAAGLAVVVYTVAHRAGSGDFAGTAQTAETEAETETAEPGETTDTPVPPADLRIALPWGAEIAETRIADDRLLLRLRHADGSESIEIFDPATGKRLRRITVDRAR